MLYLTGRRGLLTDLRAQHTNEAGPGDTHPSPPSRAGLPAKQLLGHAKGKRTQDRLLSGGKRLARNTLYPSTRPYLLHQEDSAASRARGGERFRGPRAYVCVVWVGSCRRRPCTRAFREPEGEGRGGWGYGRPRHTDSCVTTDARRMWCTASTVTCIPTRRTAGGRACFSSPPAGDSDVPRSALPSLAICIEEGLPLSAHAATTAIRAQRLGRFRLQATLFATLSSGAGLQTLLLPLLPHQQGWRRQQAAYKGGAGRRAGGIPSTTRKDHRRGRHPRRHTARMAQGRDHRVPMATLAAQATVALRVGRQRGGKGEEAMALRYVAGPAAS